MPAKGGISKKVLYFQKNYGKIPPVRDWKRFRSKNLINARLQAGDRNKKGNPMKKVICKVEYDTEASELVAKRTVGAFGDPTGYEERLYKTEGGKFFLYTVGGAQSPYTEEGIKRMSAAKADEWLAENK